MAYSLYDAAVTPCAQQLGPVNWLWKWFLPDPVDYGSFSASKAQSGTPSEDRP